MNARPVTQYHKYGCNFVGKLVVVDYLDSMQRDGAGNSRDYLEQARTLVRERYVVVRELLTVPEYVVEVA